MDQPCPHCQVGLLRPWRTTYIRVIGGTLLHIPQANAWRCDICGAVHFDPAQVRLLDMLAGEAGPPPNRHVPQPPTPRADVTDDAHTPKPRSR